MFTQNRIAQEFGPETITEIDPIALFAACQVGQFEFDLGLNVADFTFAFAVDRSARETASHLGHPVPLSVDILRLDFKRTPGFLAIKRNREHGFVRQIVGSIASPIDRRPDFIAEPWAVRPAGAHSLAALDVLREGSTGGLDLNLVGQFRCIARPRLSDLFDFGIERGAVHDVPLIVELSCCADGYVSKKTYAQLRPGGL